MPQKLSRMFSWKTPSQLFPALVGESSPNIVQGTVLCSHCAQVLREYVLRGLSGTVEGCFENCAYHIGLS